MQQLAVCYVGRGYWHYVTGRVPGGKIAGAVDAKLVAKYGIGIPKWTRSRRMKLGRAGMQYIRHDDYFVLCATAGEHRFFREEKDSILDAREQPIVYGGYSVGVRGGRVHVRMSDRAFGELRAYFLDVAVHRTVEELVGEFYGFPFEPYGPVKTQVFSILGVVNGVRRRAGLPPVPKEAVWLKRRYVKPFAEVDGSAVGAPRLGPSEI